MVKRMTTDEFIKRARNTHGDKYDYSLTCYINKNTDVEIICPIHGSFQQNPQLHIKGLGCLKCKYETTISGNEILVDIKGYEGLYKISNLGNVYSIFFGCNRLITYSITNSGYKRVGLSKGGVRKSFDIHKLVAEHFLEKIDGYEIDHINFNKLDNRAENLRYVSHIENVRRSLFYRYEYDKNKGNNPKAKTILGYRNGELIETYECGKDLCLLIGMNYSTFKYKMQRGGIIFNNIHYIYGDYNRKKISKK